MRDKVIWEILAISFTFLMLTSCITPCIAVYNSNNASDLKYVQQNGYSIVKSEESDFNSVIHIRNNAIYSVIASNNDSFDSSVVLLEDNKIPVIIQLEEVPILEYRTELSMFYSKTVDTPINKTEAILINATEMEALKSAIISYANTVEYTHTLVKSEIKQANINITLKREFKNVFNGFSADIFRSDREKIKGLPHVKAVYPDSVVSIALQDSVPLINATEVWQMKDSNNTFVTGENITVAIIDTGIDYMHPDLGSGFGPSYKVIGGHDIYNSDPDPMDDNGHGTHCAGIVAANGTLKGVAPSAKLMAYKVLSSDGWGYSSDIIAGIEMATDPDGNPTTDDGADVISMSLGGSGNPDDALSQAVDTASDAGTVVVVAAGNGGPKERTVESPGCARKAITVGATDKTDVIASWSSRGPVIWGNETLIKPDVTAPGVSINSTWLGGRYNTKSGTSMATPHVAGVATLLIQAHPDWSPEYIKSAIMGVSLDLNESYYAQGAGRVDAYSSAITELTAIPPSSSFGLLVLSNKTTIDIQLRSVTNESLDSTLDVNCVFENGTTYNYVKSNITSIVIQPNESKSVRLSLNVSEFAPIGHYFGSLVISSENQTFRVIFSFSTLSCINVRVIDFDGSICKPACGVITAYDRDNPSIWFSSWGDEKLPFVVYPGNYNVHYLDWPFDSWRWLSHPSVGAFLSEEINVPRMSIVTVNLSVLSAHNITVHIESPSDEPVGVLSAFCGLKYKKESLTMAWWSNRPTARDNYTSLPMYVSNSDANLTILYEGLPKGEHLLTSEEVYFIGWTLEGIDESTPSELRYNASELAAYNITYDVPGLLPYDRLVGTSFNPYLKGCWRPSCPWAVHVYGEPSPSRPYGFNQTFYVVPRYFWQLDYWMTYQSKKECEQVFFPIWKEGEPWVTPKVGERKDVVVGRFPLIPVVYLNNTDDYIRLHTPIFHDAGGSLAKGEGRPSIELYRNSELKFSGSGYPYWNYRAYPYWEIASAEEGDYSLNISTATNFPIYNKTEILFNFSIPSADINPPSIRMINASCTFAPNTTFPISLTCVDDQGILQVSIAYSYDNGSTWIWLPTSQTDTNIYETVIPSIPENTKEMSLKFNVIDTNGNSVEYTAIPAALEAIATQISLITEPEKEVLHIKGCLTDERDNKLPNVAIKIFLNDSLVDTIRTNSTGYYDYTLGEEFCHDIHTISVKSPSFGVYLSANATVKYLLPIANFTYSPENPVVNQTITFNASNSTDPDGFITKYEWNFGDGTNGTGEIITHSYSSAGNYTINLTVTDDDGATNSTSKAVTVEPTPTPKLMEGDVNLDNCVSLKDSTLIKLYLADEKTLNEDQKKCADTKDDDAVTLKDSTFIKKWLVDDTTPLWESPADDDMLEPVAC